MLQIRLLEQTDWQGLYDLVEPVDKALVGMQSNTEELVEDWVSTIELGIWEVYVAVLPQEEIKKVENRCRNKILPWRFLKRNPSGIVGLVTLFGDWEDEEDIHQGEFDIGITVARHYQKRGIGLQLLEYIYERGKELDYKCATLWTRVDNAPMIKLAKRLGYKEGRTRTRHGFEWNQFYKEIKKEIEEK